MNQNLHALSRNSIDFFLNQKIDTQKFLVTGSSGWLGRTFTSLASKAGHDFLLVGSHSRSISINNQNFLIEKYDLKTVQKFEPTVLVDFAFVTREHLDTISQGEYRKRNEGLLKQALEIYALPSVRYGMFTSSGAAVFPKDALLGQYSENPYGYLKRITEDMVIEASEVLGKKSILIRPWSLSGTMVSKDYEYAFSSFIRQSFGGEIIVKSPDRVFRRYVAAEDFLALALAKMFSNSSTAEVFDSGGELISLDNLAHKIAELQTQHVSVVSHQSRSARVDDYYSDNLQWARECKAFGFLPENLSDQISRNLDFLRESS